MKAQDLRRLLREAEKQEDEAKLAAACEAVGIGVQTCLSRDRRADVARKRAVVAWILCDREHWTQARAARVLRRTPRQIRKSLAGLA